MAGLRSEPLPPTAHRPRLWLLLSLLVVLAGCGGGEPATSILSSTPPHTGIVQLDHFLDLIRAGDARALHGIVGFEPQICESNPQPTPSGPLPCVSTPFDADARVDVTSEPVFTFPAASCSIAFFTRPAEAYAAVDAFIARHAPLSIYAVGRGGIRKFDDTGYLVMVTEGATPSPTARASIWFVRADGRIVRVTDDCQGWGAALLAERSGILARPLLAPSR